MTPARSLVIAMVALALLIGARPMARDEQFPRGLMSSAPRAVAACTIEARPLSFGTYDPLADTEVDAIGQIIYFCQGNDGGGGGGGGRGGGPPDGRGGGPGTRAQDKGIRIEMEEGLAGSFQPRAMFGLDATSLGYNIYLDATHRTVWGTGVGSTGVYLDANPPNGTPVTVRAYGRIFRGQDVAAGPYQDVVGVRIQF